MTDGNQPADLPLPENAAETYIISKGSYWCGDHAVARDAFVAGWAQGAAAERERMMARAREYLAAIGEDDFSPAARTVADIVLADLLAGDAP